MKPYLPLITCFFIIQDSPAQEPAELARLREQFVSAANKSVDPIAKKYIQQLELLKASYIRQGKKQESDHVENEIMKTNQATEAGLVKVTAGDLASTAGSDGGMGKDLNDLQGFWIRRIQGSSSETFEFKQRKMFRLFQYRTQDGGMSEQKTNYAVKQAGGKIMITQDGGENPEYRSWYEINTPFSLDNLEMINLSVRPDGSSKNMLYLKRKPQLDKAGPD